MRLSPCAPVLLLAVCLATGIETIARGQEVTFDSVTVVAVAQTEAEMATAQAIGQVVSTRLREGKVKVSGDVRQLLMDRVSAAAELAKIAGEQTAQQVAVVSYRRTSKQANEGLAAVTVADGIEIARGISDAIVVAMERVSEAAKAAVDWVARQAADGISAVASHGQLVAIRLHVQTTPGSVAFAVGQSSPGVTDADGLAIWSFTQPPGVVPVDFSKRGHQDIRKSLSVPKARSPVKLTISANLPPLTH